MFYVKDLEKQDFNEVLQMCNDGINPALNLSFLDICIKTCHYNYILCINKKIIGVLLSMVTNPLYDVQEYSVINNTNTQSEHICDDICLAYLLIDKKYQGRKLGRKLLTHFIKSVDKDYKQNKLKGLVIHDKIILQTNTENIRAINLYLSSGFKFPQERNLSIIKDYYYEPETIINNCKDAYCMIYELN